MTFNCTYPKIKGGYNAIIEEHGEILANDKFKNITDAGRWTNAFCEGYTKGIENKNTWETTEEREIRLKRRRESLDKLDKKHKQTMKLIKNKKWGEL
jgi:hypothetical protein